MRNGGDRAVIKGVLFDKDGTLIDFFSLWLKAATETVPLFLKMNGLEYTEELEKYVLEAIGVSDHKVDPAGALAYKSYEEIAEDITEALRKKGIPLQTAEVRCQIEDLFNQSVTGENAEYKQLADVGEMADSLKRKGIYVGLATADTLDSAQNCMDILGVTEKFDYIGADDGKRKPKPEPDMFREFQEAFHLQPEEIAVVGDSYNDIVFAKRNGGIAIGVLSGVSRLEDFRGEADYIIGSIDEFVNIVDKI